MPGPSSFTSIAAVASSERTARRTAAEGGVWRKALSTVGRRPPALRRRRGLLPAVSRYGAATDEGATLQASMTDLAENPAALLRRARKAAGLSPEASARALHIYPASVVAWESERKPVPEWAVTRPHRWLRRRAESNW